MRHEISAQHGRATQNRQIENVLALERDRPRRQHLIQLSEGHQARRGGEEAEQHFERQRAHGEAVRLQPVILRRADQCRSQRAACLRDRGPLRHVRHGHEHGERDADGGTYNQPRRDPCVIDHFMAQQRRHHRQQHPELAGEHAAPRRCRRRHPLQSKNETTGRNDVKSLPDGQIHFFAGSRFLNILSMRSVMR